METAKVGHFSPCHSVRRMSLAHYSSTDVFWVKLTPAPGYTCFWWKTCDTDLLNTNMNNKDSCSNPLRFLRTDTLKTWTDVVEHMSAMCFCQCPQNTPTHKPVIVQDQYLSLLTVQLRLAHYTQSRQCPGTLMHWKNTTSHLYDQKNSSTCFILHWQD